MLGLYMVITKSGWFIQAGLTKGIHSESTEGVRPPLSESTIHVQGRCYQDRGEGGERNTTITLEFQVNHVAVSAVD